MRIKRTFKVHAVLDKGFGQRTKVSFDHDGTLRIERCTGATVFVDADELIRAIKALKKES